MLAMTAEGKTVLQKAEGSTNERCRWSVWPSYSDLSGNKSLDGIAVFHFLAFSMRGGADVPMEYPGMKVKNRHEIVASTVRATCGEETLKDKKNSTLWSLASTTLLIG